MRCACAILLAMRPRYAYVCVLTTVWLLAACSDHGSSTTSREAPVSETPDAPTPTIEWYDAKPLLASVRPTLHAPLLAAIAPRSMNDLPLYDMQVDIDLGSARFTLKQVFWWTQTETTPLPDLAFRIYANTAATLGATTPPVRMLKGRCPEDPGCTVAQPAADVITVTPSRPIAPGQRYRVELDIEGTLTRIDSSRTNMLAQGIESMATMGSPHGNGDYGLLAVGDGVASLANFYPTLARRKHGRWIQGEENLLGDLGSDDLVHVRAQVTVDPGVDLISSGVITDRAASQSGRTRFSTVAAGVREVALIASRQLRSASVKVGDIRVTSHYLPPDSASGIRALDIAKSSLEIFQRRFGDYPYTELDVVEAAVVGGAGGVEFSGLVTIASMLYRPMSGGPLGAMLNSVNAQGATNGEALREAMFEFVVAHEVAHQYWHVLVGNDCRDHPFDDEALAQHSAVVYLEDRYGQERARRDEQTQVANGFRMMRSMGHVDGAVDQPVAAFGAPIEYAGLIYGKGPMVYRALRNQTGEDGFFEAIRTYVKLYRFRTAPPRGLIETIAARGRAIQVRNIAAHWLDEQHGDQDLGPLNMATVTGQPSAPVVDALPQPENNAAQREPSNQEMQELMKMLPAGGATPDLNQLLQQMQQMQQPHGE